MVIRSGLSTGERVCLTSLEAATEGMRVRVVDQGSAADTEDAEASDDAAESKSSKGPMPLPQSSSRRRGRRGR